MSKRGITRVKSIMLLLCVSFLIAQAVPQQAKASDTPVIESETAVLIDGATGETLWGKDSTKRMYPASVTKIITAIVAIEEGNLEEKVAVSENVMDVIGTRVYLLPGEEVSLLKLVQGLMINSGNDAGLAIAEHMDGSEEAFAKRMNRFVEEEIGVKDSHFTNPHGLFDENHYTTAKDLAMITKYAMENEVFKEIAQTKEMEWIGEGWETTIYNHHRMLWDYDGVTGVKNGFVQRSGFTLSTAVERDDMELIAVTLNAPAAKVSYQDTAALFDYGFTRYEPHVIKSDRLFSDESGRKYELENDIYYVMEKGKESTVEVTNEGMLQIKNTEGKVLKEVPLKELKDKEDLIDNPNVNETAEQGFIQWFLRFIPFTNP
ncbi:D-alanyl-D-alanine carboxypeptidase S11 serine type [Alkalihalophilus pseudofirmus OF4]|uniref:D-alanyl-D-alanine carboxypeptidase S11 serine type n=1 Tax=Alkalihalophilus pseudofirmus (strain ATCC BAA-2126 / JCM 17055 / OF4) TaxID=398511 RepID=D3FVG2_ALKPO|nr:D-alanyl-D-alanine carboxypeptidase family protein [Alkalihalophilus pseudofirmus]ADC48477.1 D-alanyl-D-alanine carboxypeptidase S11 serine type [Alkalihalophilus pseudofirmus OF4]